MLDMQRQSGDWCNGSTKVSDTFSKSSNLLSPIADDMKDPDLR